MESAAEGANSGKRLSRWLACRFERVERGWKFRAPTARVTAFGAGEEGGRLREKMRMSRRRMENKMEVVLQNCLESLE